MNRIFTRNVLIITILALVMWGCDDEKEIIPPTTVTLSSGTTSTDFNTFLFTAFSFFGIDMLIIMGANSTDTLAIATFSFGQLATDSPIALSDTLLVIGGTLGGGQITALNGAGASGTLTFTRLDTLGFVSGEFSDNATLRGIAADESTVTVSISGGFAAVGGSVEFFGDLSKKLPRLPGEGERSAVPFE